MSDVTELLAAIQSGKRQAAEELLPVVYDELRRLARQKLAQEKPGQTLQATALVHEAYLRLVRPQKGEANSDLTQNQPAAGPEWNNRAHFFRAAAEAMRRILVDSARRKRSAKHGGSLDRAELAEVPAPQALDLEDVIVVSEALEKFEQQDAAKAELVKLRYFAGLTIEEAAMTLGISHATAERHWTYAKTWLFRELSRSGASSPRTESQEFS
jgi:RNA polymerase sigma factor (TIGR02999 family)